MCCNFTVFIVCNNSFIILLEILILIIILRKFRKYLRKYILILIVHIDYIIREIALKYRKRTFTVSESYAIAESTPGPVAVNSATYIGYKLAGVAGAAASTLAVCLPSFAVIYLISLFFDRFLQLTVVANAFKGIQACVIYLILSAGVKMLKNLQRTPFNTAVVAVVLAAMVGCSMLAVKFSSICCILLCGAAGVLAYAIGRGKKGGTK